MTKHRSDIERERDLRRMILLVLRIIAEALSLKG